MLVNQLDQLEISEKGHSLFSSNPEGIQLNELEIALLELLLEHFLWHEPNEPPLTVEDLKEFRDETELRQAYENLKKMGLVK
jgi:hypothetical protein